MWHTLLLIASAIVGIVAGAALGVWSMRRRRGKGGAGAALVASALFFSFGSGFNNRGHDLIQDFKDGAKQKKDAQSGDPPSEDL